MTQEYTPTTEEVCECWTTRYDIGNPYETDADVEERHHEESVKFDYWLAAHDAQIREESWDEGHQRGWIDGVENAEPASPNPYRKENRLYKSNGLQSKGKNK